jgi:hypothetical protein
VWVVRVLAGGASAGAAGWGRGLMLDGRRLDESTGAIAEEAEAQRRKKERAKGKLFTARR